MLSYLAFKLLQFLEPVLFPAPRLCGVQTRVISFKQLVYAHRGGGLEPGVGAENTMSAFRNAARLNVDLLELDVQVTKDGKLVVFHDRDLERMAGPAYRKKRVRDLDYQDLPRITPHAERGATGVPAGVQAAGSQATDAAATRAATTIDGDRIPLLAEVFAEFPNIPIQVDIKVTDPGVVERVCEEVCRHTDRWRRLLWGSFRHRVQAQLYEANPHIPLFTSMWRTLYLRLAHAVDCMHTIHIYESAVIVPWRIPALWGKAKHWYPFLDRGWCEALAARGVSVVYYGRDLNDAHAYRTCIQAGASAVCTDRPALLQTFLAAQQHTGKGSQTTDTTQNNTTNHNKSQSNGQGNGNGLSNGYTNGHSHNSSDQATREQLGAGVGVGVGVGVGTGGVKAPLEFLRVDADAVCQHTGRAAVVPCGVCMKSV